MWAGYEVFKGRRLQADEFETLVEGLEVNKLLGYTHVLTGYIGTTALLVRVCVFVCLL